MRVLVTGGSGAIGTFVVRNLQGGGHDVEVFDLDPPTVDGVEYTAGDITDRDAVRRAVADADVVVHLAALLPDACRRDPRRAERVNVAGTLAVFEAAIDRQIRVVYASSKAVFGAITGVRAHPTYEPIGEDAPHSPVSVYGVTKSAVERYADAYRADGLDAAALRFASTYGPGKGDAHGELATLSAAIRQAAAGERIHLSGVDQRNDFVYYGDIARGIEAAIEAAHLGHGTYHIGSGEAVSIREFADALREHTGATIETEGGLNYREADQPTYARLDISRARADLGYEPAFPIDRGIDDFLNWL